MSVLEEPTHQTKGKVSDNDTLPLFVTMPLMFPPRRSLVSNLYHVACNGRTPHHKLDDRTAFYLTRKVNASRLVAWREHVNQHAAEKITFTGLFVQIVAAAWECTP